MDCWPCGCVTWKEGMVFKMRRCEKPDCKVWPVVKEESARRGNLMVTVPTNLTIAELRDKYAKYLREREASP
jgi:hypothetical protein